jgi:hypothetical protein
VSKKLCFAFAASMAVPGALLGQEKSQAQATPPANPITASEKGLYSFVSNAVIGAAQKMPEANYSFKPTPEVRSFGQIVGHVADASYMFCSLGLGRSQPSKGNRKNEDLKSRSCCRTEGACIGACKTDPRVASGHPVPFEMSKVGTSEQPHGHHPRG